MPGTVLSMTHVPADDRRPIREVMQPLSSAGTIAGWLDNIAVAGSGGGVCEQRAAQINHRGTHPTIRIISASLKEHALGVRSTYPHGPASLGRRRRQVVQAS